MTRDQIQELCELGQRQLSHCKYLDAEKALAAAELMAWNVRDFDTLSRLYLPLLEARRQRRQRCSEGTICLDLIASGPDDQIDARQIADKCPHGQLMIAGWGSIEPAIALRRLHDQFALYVETFLAAAYPTHSGRVVVIVPLDDTPLPSPVLRSLDELRAMVSSRCIVMRDGEVPRSGRQAAHLLRSTVMQLWDQLHAPYLAEAEAQTNVLTRIDFYRRVMQVDYAAETAHQRLSEAAKLLARNS